MCATQNQSMMGGSQTIETFPDRPMSRQLHSGLESHLHTMRVTICQVVDGRRIWIRGVVGLVTSQLFHVQDQGQVECKVSHPCSATRRPVAGLNTCTGDSQQDAGGTPSNIAAMELRSVTTALCPSR